MRSDRFLELTLTICTFCVTIARSYDLNEEDVMSMKDSLSQSRFSRYLASAGGDEARAIELYQWNTLTAQSLYVYLQCWEIAFRNKADSFLRWKFRSNAWPYDARRAVRSLARDESRRLQETINRQEQKRKLSPVSTDAIVADLSAGFWVALLSTSYEVPYAWRYNLKRIFPNDNQLDRKTAHGMSERILNLRNRIAHHEPIYGLALYQTYAELQRLVAAMCADTDAFARSNCTFLAVLARQPAFLNYPSSTPK